MLHVDTITAQTGVGLLAPDLQRLVRIVAIWAAERPLVYDVFLSGPRIRPGHNSTQTLQCAVRFDEAHLIEGFDDWIEDLRSNFASLSEALGEPVNVITPDMRRTWTASVKGTELHALSFGKVRIVTAEACEPRQAVRQEAPQPSRPLSRWSAIWQMIAAATSIRRPAL